MCFNVLWIKVFLSVSIFNFLFDAEYDYYKLKDYLVEFAAVTALIYNVGKLHRGILNPLIIDFLNFNSIFF